MVSLEEGKAKELAEVITNDTSRKILNYLADQEDVVETDLAKELGLPLSTVHYNLQKLVKAGLVATEEFHYSKKGREFVQKYYDRKIIAQNLLDIVNS